MPVRILIRRGFGSVKLFRATRLKKKNIMCSYSFGTALLINSFSLGIDQTVSNILYRVLDTVSRTHFIV